MTASSAPAQGFDTRPEHLARPGLVAPPAYDSVFSTDALLDWLQGRGGALTFAGYGMWPADTLSAPGPSFVQAAEHLIGSLKQYAISYSEKARAAWEAGSEPVPTEQQLEYQNDLVTFYALRADGLAEDYRERWRRACVGIISSLYFHCLYRPQFTLGTMIKGQQYGVPFQAGHRWGDDAVLGPVQPCDLLIVGKHPGREESAQGRLWCGESGSMLADELHEAGLEDEVIDRAYVTNVVRFPNPDPASDRLAAHLLKDCRPLLELEIRLLRPKWILALGREAIEAVVGRGKNLKNTGGRVLTKEFLAGPWRPGQEPEKAEAKVVTCVHPAAVLHKPQMLPELKKGLGFFSRALHGQHASTGQDPEANCDYRVIQTRAELEAWERELVALGCREFSVDTEFHGLYPGEPGAFMRTVQVSWGCKKSACLVLTGPAERGEDAEIVLPKEDVASCLTRLLRGPDRRLIMHYGMADIPWLEWLGLDWVMAQFETPDDDPFPPPAGQRWIEGWEKTATQGGFDTILAAHAVEETADLDLKSQAQAHTTMGAYNAELEDWLEKYCKKNKIKKKSLAGYGMVPLDIVGRTYGNADSDGGYRLKVLYNGDGTRAGLLDHDRFGNSSRVPYWISMRALPAFMEMTRTGMLVDKRLAGEMRVNYGQARDIKLEQLREAVHWPTFNPKSHYDCRALLFGPEHAGKRDKQGRPNYVLPEGARSLNLAPYKTTGKRPKMWEDIVRRGEVAKYTPSTDKETLSVIGVTSFEAWLLRDAKYMSQVCTSLLREPAKNADGSIKAVGGGIAQPDDFEEQEYDQGLLSYICQDGRVRTHFSQTKETGRASSWKPALQNLGSRRQEDYDRIFQEVGLGNVPPIRSVFVASTGYVFVYSDYVGAELLGVAGQAQDMQMMDHCRRMKLPESDPEHLCIHCNVAIQAFRLRMPDGSSPHPSKKGLSAYAAATGDRRPHRKSAKPVVFGRNYGMAEPAAQRKAKEEGVDLSFEDASALLRGMSEAYPGLDPYSARARQLSVDSGWICNCFGRYRRFFPSDDFKVKADQEREAQNFPTQSQIADAVSRALDHLYHYPNRARLGYRMVLQIHDAILFEVPYASVDEMVNVVIPECMVDRVPIPVRDLDGAWKDAPPYRLGVDTEVSLRFGVPITAEECRQCGISEKYAHQGS